MNISLPLGSLKCFYDKHIRPHISIKLYEGIDVLVHRITLTLPLVHWFQLRLQLIYQHKKEYYHSSTGNRLFYENELILNMMLGWGTIPISITLFLISSTKTWVHVNNFILICGLMCLSTVGFYFLYLYLSRWSYIPPC